MLLCFSFFSLLSVLLFTVTIETRTGSVVQYLMRGRCGPRESLILRDMTIKTIILVQVVPFELEKRVNLNIVKLL